MGIEPTSEAWEASILPMNYARMKHVYSITRKKFLQAENFQKSIEGDVLIIYNIVLRYFLHTFSSICSHKG